MKSAFIHGLRDGIPISLGYFAVSFSLGIVASCAGLSPIEGFCGSFFTRASAGEYGVYSLIAVHATFIEIVLISLVANMRYLLMGAALSQRFAPDMPLWKRIGTACCITDEIFGISIAYPQKYIPMSYPLGATLIAGFMWAMGTATGIISGNILPPKCVTALSVALYGMFIAVIIPPSRKDKNIAVAVISSFIISYLFSFINISEGIRTIILTLIISAVAAVIKPVKENV